MTKPDQELGRRERNKLEKQTRIFDAAAELFAEKGYSAVTTQEIADRADVAGGTLFRYAASKAELLLMVYNAEYRKQIELGEEREAKSTGTEDRVLELVSPLLIASRRNDENTGIYQREVLFGEPSECFRAEGLETRSACKRGLRKSCTRHTPTTPPEPPLQRERFPTCCTSK
ncbi:helix-turn-helix domain-containing protein [Rhodococcus sp. 3Y1]